MARWVACCPATCCFAFCASVRCLLLSCVDTRVALESIGCEYSLDCLVAVHLLLVLEWGSSRHSKIINQNKFTHHRWQLKSLVGRLCACAFLGKLGTNWKAGKVMPHAHTSAHPPYACFSMRLQGEKHGEVWSVGAGGERYNRWWNEQHYGNGQVRVMPLVGDSEAVHTYACTAHTHAVNTQRSVSLRHEMVKHVSGSHAPHHPGLLACSILSLSSLMCMH